MRTEPLPEHKTMAFLILEEGDSLRCDAGEIPVLIEEGMRYTITVKEQP